MVGLQYKNKVSLLCLYIGAMSSCIGACVAIRASLRSIM